MPLPAHLLFTFASGVLVALVAHAELRGSPSRASATPTFHAYLTYLALVLLPGSLFLYVRYGDWYLLYLLDTQRVPSALVLIGALLAHALGAGGFLLGAACIRRHREPWAGALAGISLSIALASLSVVGDRLAVVGSYTQFRGDFGLVPFGGALLQSVVCITFFSLLGFVATAYQVLSSRRPA